LWPNDKNEFKNYKYYFKQVFHQGKMDYIIIIHSVEAF
jgi:hypothetical protein